MLACPHSFRGPGKTSLAQSVSSLPYLLGGHLPFPLFPPFIDKTTSSHLSSQTVTTILTKPHKTMSGLFTQEKLRVGYPELCPAPCGAVQFQEGLQIQVDDLTSLLDLKVISITATIGRVHPSNTDTDNTTHAVSHGQKY